MGLEIEAKFRCADLEPVRRRLRAGGAQPAGCALETNRIFDTPERRLRRADCGLRVRQFRRVPDDLSATLAGPVLLTFKGPRTAGDVKSREELETTVKDSDALVAILRRLGFGEVIVYEKRRETWRVGACQVALDELPKLGCWVEIEGPSPAAIGEVREQLGLESTPPVRETYVEMAAAHGRRTPPVAGDFFSPILRSATR